MTQTTNSSGASSTKPIIVERTLKQPKDKVWQAFSDPETFKKWWGPKDYTCPECKIDFRVGGQLLACMRSNAGNDSWSTGTFKEIVPGKKIVVTDSFCDKDGNVINANEAGLPGNWPDECLITVEFEGAGDNTELKLRHEGIPAEMHDDCVQGWNESLDKIEKL